MSEPDHGSVREEAQRLVASALAMATRFAQSTDVHASGPTMATGSAECCVCPICRTIAAMRDPDPDLGERLAAGAGDLAAGVASLLRSFNAPPTAPRPGPDDDPARADAWRAATQRPGPDAAPSAGEAGRGTAPAGDGQSATDDEPAADAWRAATQRPGPDAAPSATDGEPAADVWGAAGQRSAPDEGPVVGDGPRPAADEPAVDAWRAATQRPGPDDASSADGAGRTTAPAADEGPSATDDKPAADLWGAATGGEPAGDVWGAATRRPGADGAQAARPPRMATEPRAADESVPDLAAGVAGLLRSLGDVFGQRRADDEPPADAWRAATQRPAPDESAPDGPAADARRAATQRPAPDEPASDEPAPDTPRDGAADVWRQATRSGDDVDRPADGDVWSAATSARPTKPMARKAVRKVPPPDDDSSG